MTWKLKSVHLCGIFTVLASLSIHISKTQNVPGAFENLRLLSNAASRQVGDLESVEISLQNTVLEFSRMRRNVGGVHDASSNKSICMRDLGVLLDGLINERALWAVSMLDASGRPPSGILRGNLWWIGEYSECLENDLNLSAPFSTAYCSLTIGNVSHISAVSVIKWDVCVPSSCTDDALQSLINTEYLLGDIKVLQMACSTGETIPMTAGAIAVICLLSVVALIILIATVYDVIWQSSFVNLLTTTTSGLDFLRQLGSERGLGSHGSVQVERDPVDNDSNRVASSDDVPLLIPPSPVTDQQLQQEDRQLNLRDEGYLRAALLSFSVCKNTHKILLVDSSNAENSVLHAINGIRFLSMSWVILGHTWLFVLGFTRNLVDVLDFVKPFSFQVILNATVSVDTFFLLSGTLLSYQLLRELRRSEGPRNVSWIKLIIHRYFRLTPVYMIVMAVFTTLFVYWYSGPFVLERYDNPCHSDWWTNLLYINNLVDGKTECFGWSWYLANDMQFFLVSLGLVVLIHKHFVLGMLAVSLVTAVSWIVAGVIIWTNGFPASTFGFLLHPELDQAEWFKKVYAAPWCRAGSYMVGVVLGAMLHRCNCKVRIHWVLVVVGWCLAASLSVVTLYVPSYYEINGHYLTTVGHAIYGAVHRTLWAISIAWVIFACVTGHGGYVNTVLSWSGFAPLSRLTYSAYLVHPMVIFWNYYNLRFPLQVSYQAMIMLFCGHLLLSYGVAFVIFLALEAPTINIMAAIMRKGKGRQT